MCGGGIWCGWAGTGCGWAGTPACPLARPAPLGWNPDKSHVCGNVAGPNRQVLVVRFAGRVRGPRRWATWWTSWPTPPSTRACPTSSTTAAPAPCSTSRPVPLAWRSTSRCEDGAPYKRSPMPAPRRLPVAACRPLLVAAPCRSLRQLCYAVRCGVAFPEWGSISAGIGAWRGVWGVGRRGAWVIRAYGHVFVCSADGAVAALCERKHLLWVCVCRARALDGGGVRALVGLPRGWQLCWAQPLLRGFCSASRGAGSCLPPPVPPLTHRERSEASMWCGTQYT